MSPPPSPPASRQAPSAAPLLTLLPPAPSPGPSVQGELTKDVIRRVIYVHVNEIRHCYQLELQMRPTLSGRVTFRFRITDRGQVRDVALERSTLNLPSLHLCLKEAVQRWEFPATYNQGVTQVSYPFLLRPREKEQAAVGVKVSDEELARLGVLKEATAPDADILFQ